MSANPFTFGNPIRDPARFYGRKQDIRQIVGRLLSSAHESTSIVGERRLGKTSLLYHLSNPDVAATLGLSPNHYCLVYIDFQGLTDITPQRFWHRVLDKMARSVCDRDLVPAIHALRDQDNFDLFDLEDLFDTIDDRGLYTVLFMDEFDYVTQNPKFHASFFGGLRALAMHHGLALVPATRRDLVDLCHSDEIKGSPFFNIFANVVLRPFAREDADELIEGYLKGADLAFTVTETEFVHRLGGGHPFFLQIAGHYLVEARRQGLRSNALAERLAADFDQQADPHHRYLWSHCPESEKITLLVTLTLSRQKPSAKTIASLENLAWLHARAHVDVPSLLKRGLLIETDDLYRLFSPSLERWIVREVTAPAGQEESQATAEEWLKAGGQEDLEPVRGILPRFKKKYWPVVADILKEISVELPVKVVTALLTGRLP